MLLRPDRHDLQIIAYALGGVLSVLGMAMLVPAVIGLFAADWNALSAMAIGAGLTSIAGVTLRRRFFTREPLGWTHVWVTVAAAWLLGPIFAAVPLYLSGHWASFWDALFEAMSGLTTTGLTLAQDVDHLSVTISIWRHLTQFVGGQAFIVVVLTVFAAAAGQVSTLLGGEIRNDRIIPNVSQTVRFVLSVAGAWAIAGIGALTVAGVNAGLALPRAIYHAATLFLSAFNTSSFTVQSASAGYYHSFAVEAVLATLMVAGALSYAIHYQMWRGDNRELVRSIESRTALASLFVLTIAMLLGLGRSGAFTEALPIFRRGLFTMVSAHTTSGLLTTHPRLIVTDWGLLAPAAIVGAMGMGGMAASTAGGIKSLRIGMAVKGLMRDVKKVLLPESALVVETYYLRGRHPVRDAQVRAAATILLLYLGMFTAGGVIALYYAGTFDFTEALFESVAASSNTGMSVGLLGYTSPLPLKLTLLGQMWIGRLEFMAVFSLIAFGVTYVRGRA